MVWLQHLDDLESDFSAIHRVDDMYALPGPKFFRLAYRLPAYESVMRMRVREQEDTDTERPPGGDAQVESTPDQLAALQAGDQGMFGDLFSFGTATA